MDRMAFNPYKPSKKHVTWWVRGNDHQKIHRKMTGFRSLDATQRLCRVLTDMVERVASGGSISDQTLEWVNSKLDEDRRRRLIQWGLIDPSRLVVGMSIDAHLDAWKQYMGNIGLTPKHVHQEHLRAKVLVEACGARNFSDLRSTVVLGKAAELKGQNGWSATTHRGYLVALKDFSNWMIDPAGRATSNPLATLKIPTVAEGDVKPIQTLDAEQQRTLITGVLALPNRACLTGAERSLLYQLAIYTSWRASPLMQLRKLHCHTEDAEPWIEAPAGGRKRRTNLPLTPELAEMLRKHNAMKMPDAFVFGGRRRVDQLANMLRSDCEKLGIPSIKFHELRHTAGTNLMRADVHPRVAQEIMGHAQISTTMKVYTHAGWSDKLKALKSVASSVAQVGKKEVKKAQEG